MYFSIAPPGPKISAIVGFFKSGADGRKCVRSGCAGAVATACMFSLARLDIGKWQIVRVGTFYKISGKPRTDKIAHPGDTRRFAILAAMAKTAAAKKIFL